MARTITAEAVYALREQTGQGLAQCKIMLYRERMMDLVKEFGEDGDPKKLVEVLIYLVAKAR